MATAVKDADETDVYIGMMVIGQLQGEHFSLFDIIHNTIINVIEMQQHDQSHHHHIKH